LESLNKVESVPSEQDIKVYGIYGGKRKTNRKKHQKNKHTKKIQKKSRKTHKKRKN